MHIEPAFAAGSRRITLPWSGGRLQSLSLMLVATLLMTLAALGTSGLTMQRQRALYQSNRLGDVFAVTQARSSLLRLQAGIAAYALTPNPVTQARLLPDLETLRKDADTLRMTPVGSQPVVAELTRAIDTVRPLLPAIAAPDSLVAVQRTLAPLDPALARLASMSFWSYSATTNAEQARLTQLYWLCAGLIAGLIACVAGLIALLLRQRRHAEHVARHDPLTGLPNRLLFIRQLEEVLAQPDADTCGISMLFIDLDDFKDLNDSLGHVAGDAMLRILAERLRAAVPHGVVARLNGDEFAVMLPAGGRTAAADLAMRIGALLSEPVELWTGLAITTASIGIALHAVDARALRGSSGPDAAHDAITLLKHADMALHEAKSAGRGSFHFYDTVISVRLQNRITLEADLRAALGTPQFHLVYQPLISLGSNRIIGFEALLRWDHPTRGPVSPAAFIPIAEASGLILPLGEQVLRQACREAARWPGDIKVAVNLSPRQLKLENLVSIVRDALGEAGLPAHRLELEITESALLQDGELVQATLHDLRRLGVHMALDDFGTGYSSLSYLQRFPFDKIKVDQSFVRGMTKRPESVAIVELITNLARRLGMTTTAEGIEDEILLRMVLDAGCTEGQGYHFDRPLRPEDALARLHHAIEAEEKIAALPG